MSIFDHKEICSALRNAEIAGAPIEERIRLADQARMLLRLHYIDLLLQREVIPAVSSGRQTEAFIEYLENLPYLTDMLAESVVRSLKRAAK